MKATEVINKVKELLLHSEKPEEKEVVLAEEVLEQEVKEEVEVKEEKVEEVVEVAEEVELAEEVAEAPTEEVKQPEVVVEAASKDDLVALKTEILDLIADLMKEKESNKDVPQELSQEEKVEEITHSPEAEVKVKFNHKIAPNRSQTTRDKVFNRLFSN